MFQDATTNVWLFTYFNNKLFSHELKILNYDRLRENKKFLNETYKIDSLIFGG